MEKKLYANVIAITVMIAAPCTVQIVPCARTVIDVESVAMVHVMTMVMKVSVAMSVANNFFLQKKTSFAPNVTDVVIVAMVHVMNMATTIIIVCLLITFVTSATTVDTT